MKADNFMLGLQASAEKVGAYKRIVALGPNPNFFL